MDNLKSKSITSNKAQHKGGLVNSDLSEVYDKMISPFENEMAKYTLRACKDGEYSILAYNIKNNIISDYTVRCVETGNTILHYVCQYYNMVPDNKVILDTILKSDHLNEFINIQNRKHGNTALHIAVLSNDDDMADKLIEHGADMKIRNKNKLYVALNDEYSDTRSVADKKKDDDSSSSSSTSSDEEDGGILDNLSNIVNSVLGDEDDVTSIDLADAQTETDVATQSMIDNIENEILSETSIMPYSSVNLDDEAVKLVPVSVQETETVVSNTSDDNNQVNKVEENKVEENEDTPNLAELLDTEQSAPDQSLSGGYTDANTSEFISKLRNLYNRLENSDLFTDTDNKQKGGANKNGGSRKLQRPRAYSPISELSGGSELARAVNNQATAIHERTILNIKNLLGVDLETAKAYKAVAYGEVKKNNPELNNYDRAVAMENMINEKYLKSISSKIEEVKQYLSEKSSASSDEEPKAKKTKKVKEVKEVKDKKTKKEKETKTKKTKKVKEVSETSTNFDSDSSTSSD